MKVVSLQLPSGPSMERLPLPFSPTELLWRYPLPWGPPPPSPLGDAKALLPTSLPPEPRLWTRDDVTVFLKWCEREFDLPNFDMDLFQMNGKALCLLTKTDLGERCPGAGDVLHNVLQMLVRDAALLGRVPSSPVTPTARAAPYPPSPHSHPPTPTWAVDGFHHFHSAAAAAAAQPNSVTLSPAPSVDSSGSPQRGDQINYAPAYATTVPQIQAGSSGSNHSDSDEEGQFAAQPRSPKDAPLNSPAPQNHPAPQHSHYRGQHREFFPNDMPETNTNGRLLWDFLQQLLNDPTQRYTNYIAWKNRDTGVFKIVDPAGLAKLWGIQKNHLSMNYDKMSRALRYYYRVNILRKVQGERHCYQFLRNPTELKNIKNISLLRQQMSPTRVPPLPSIVKTEIKEDRCEEENVDEDMPTDLSMAASEPWKKRARADQPSIQQHDKHRISALIGENMMLKRESEYNTEHYALNLKSDKCEQ